MIKQYITIFFLLLAVGVWGQDVGSEQLVVYLIRHAKVDLQTPALCFSKKAEAVHQKYDRSPIEDFDPVPVRQQIDEDPLIVYASTLPRAIATAQILFPEADSILLSHLFDEYDLSVISFPILPLPYKAWTGLSRLVWILHLNKQDESRSEAIRRMKLATDLLINLTQENKTTVLVAHGFLISDMRRELKKRGWQVAANGGNKNLAVTKMIYEFR